MLDSIGRPQRLVTDWLPFLPTPLNKDDDARTARIAAEAADNWVRAVPTQPLRPGHAFRDDLLHVGSVVLDAHDGRTPVKSALASSV